VNDAELTELRREIALACRMIASSDLTTPVLGHVSVRLDESHVLVRCRGEGERGLLFTTAEDIRVATLDDAGDVGGGYRLPNEFPIHAELLRTRPELGSVLHAHPRSALLAGLADVELRPVFGAFDIPAFRLAEEGVPVHEHRGLVRTPAEGRALAATVGARSVGLLRGHGVVAVGVDVPQVMARLLALDELLSVSVDLMRLCARPEEVSERDRADLPDLGAAFNERAVWRYQLGLLERQGLLDVG
jgi:ribulose-5-phosphate 4-epimerase/fuculose-1-phosphate aldolase